VAAAAAIGLIAVGSALPAQSRLELDVAGTRIEYDTLAPLDAPSVSGLTEWQRPSMFVRVSGGVTRFENAGWSLQGRGDVAGWLSPLGSLSPLRLELGGGAGGGRHSSGFDSYLMRGDARLHLRGAGFGAWAGASLAGARNSFDTASVSGIIPNAGLWAQGGAVRATLSYQHTRVFDDAYPEMDLALALTRGAADLTLYAGLRDSPFAADSRSERWAGASAVYWVTRNAGLVVSVGKYSADVLQGLPGGDFVSVGLRLTPRRVRPIPISAPAPIVYTAEEARRGSIRFDVADATTVEIAGDWNGWTPEPLVRDAAGRWTVAAVIAPGVHRFNLRVDGEHWIVPVGVPTVDDGFGGQVGLMIVSAP
jgi:hypothetical protein